MATSDGGLAIIAPVGTDSAIKLGGAFGGGSDGTKGTFTSPIGVPGAPTGFGGDGRRVLFEGSGRRGGFGLRLLSGVSAG